MAIRKRGNSWQIDVLIPTGQKDEDGRDIKKRVRRTFSKKKNADAEHDKIKTLVREKRFLDVKKEYYTTFKELLNKYEENHKHQRSFEGWKRYSLENFRDYFGEDTLLANIKYINFETYRNHLRQKPTKSGSLRTDASVNRETSCLHHIFTKAVEWDMIDSSPFDKGKSLLLKENNKRLRFLSEEETQKLLPECPEHLRRIVEFAINTGMRQGEILNLKWNQIRNGLIYLRETKTDESREIPINGDLERVFRDIRREQQFKSEYVFTYAKSEDKLKGKEPVRKRVKPASCPASHKEHQNSLLCVPEKGRNQRLSLP